MKSFIPEAELKFASKTGFLTLAQWREFFFQEASRSWAYEKWSLLSERGYFKSHFPYRSSDILVPNPGNETVRNVCSSGVVHPPYAGQFRHDEILSDGLLMLIRDQVVSRYLTEAELKRAESTGIAKGPDALKLPDLLLDLQSGRVAIEMEITQKSRKRYWSLLHAYRMRREVSSVIFIVPSRTVLDAIVNAASQVMFPQNAISLGFMNIEDWISKPSTSPIAFAKTRSSLMELAKAA